MWRTISGTTHFEQRVADKFSMIYMEIQTHPVNGKRQPKTVWHLEDENRPSLALCGFALQEVCKSVSPALAMLGKPCEACTKIVEEWLFSAKEERTRERRLIQLLGNDVAFRSGATKVLAPELFYANYVEPSAAQKVLANPHSTEKAKSIATRVVARIRSEKVAAPVTRVSTGGRKTAPSRPR